MSLMDSVDDLLIEASRSGCILTEASLEIERDSFLYSIDKEMQAFANRKLNALASDFSKNFSEPMTNSFDLAAGSIVRRYQFMTAQQKADLSAALEVHLKKIVFEKFPGRNEVETNELAANLKKVILSKIQSISYSMSGSMNFEQHEV